MFSSVELRRARLQNLSRIIEEHHLDGLLLTKLENVRYATDVKPLHSIFFVDNYISVIVPGEKPFLLASEADGNFVTTKMPWVQWIPLPSFVPSGTTRDEQTKLIAQALGNKAHRIGYDSLSIGQFQSLSETLQVDFIPVSNDILRMRAVKSDMELDVMERAVQFAEIGMAAVREHLHPGVAEFELVAEAIYAMKKAGAEAESHLPAIRSGENAAMLQRVDSDTPVRPGDSVVADLGARYLGYSAEYCRTMMLGRPSRKLKEMYKILFEAYFTGIDMIKPGVIAKDVDRAIRKVITNAGYPDYPHATGHGIGMANAEYPTINKTEKASLEEGMIICLEPGIYVPGIGGVKEEDLILVTDTGFRVLTKSPYDQILSRDT